MKNLMYLCFFVSILFSCERKDMDQAGNLVPKTVAEDPLLPRFEINGTVLHGETFGDIHNPIMVFLHGGPGSDYRAMISQIGEENASRYPNKRNISNGGLSQLQEKYFCIFYDQRGAGLSTRYAYGDLSFDEYVTDLDAIIDFYLNKKKVETGIEDSQVYLFGWSFGGILSTGYINTHPEKIKDVVLYEPGPFTKEVWDYFKENTTSVFDQLGDEWLEDFLLANEHFTSDTHERADYQNLLGAFRSNPQFHENINNPLWRVGALMEGGKLDFSESNNYDITSNLNAFAGRMLFLGGELTMNEYPNYISLQTHHYPQNETVIISGVGHTGPWEKPNIIAQLIGDFFQN